MNTFLTNCLIGNTNIQNGSLGFNLVNGNRELLNANQTNLNKKGQKYIIKKLEKIKLPRIIRITYVMINQYNLYFDDIVYYSQFEINKFKAEIKKIRNKNKKPNDTRTPNNIERDNKKKETKKTTTIS